MEGAVAHQQNNGRVGAEPGVQKRETSVFVAAILDASAGSQQMFDHVRAEISQQFELLFQLSRWSFNSEEAFTAGCVHVLDMSTIIEVNYTKKINHLLSSRVNQDLCAIVENDANTVVAELVAKSVLVRVVDPFGNPKHWSTCRILVMDIH